MFLFDTRYCGKCGNAYLWEKVKINQEGIYKGDPMCECGSYLWAFKSSAQDELNKK